MVFPFNKKVESSGISAAVESSAQPMTVSSMSKTKSGEYRSIYETILASQGKELTSSLYSYREALHRPVPIYSYQTRTRNYNSLSVGNQQQHPVAVEQMTRICLPYFLPWYPTAGPSAMPPDFSWVSESCAGKAMIGVIGGGVMGLVMGVFLGAMSDATPPVQIIAGKEVPQAPLREQLKVTLRATADKSLYWCRNFAFITGVFGGTDCLVEKYRGKHDVWNSVASGCITGAALQAKQGPQAAALGCGGFAAFSLVIDSFIGHH